MHACGHNTHVVSLMATLTLMTSAQKEWSGVLICLFQLNEEHGGGARAMVDDGLYDMVPKADLILGQHACPLKSGVVAIRAGPSMPGSWELVAMGVSRKIASIL